jgi:hypothetical protein
VSCKHRWSLAKERSSLWANQFFFVWFWSAFFEANHYNDDTKRKMCWLQAAEVFNILEWKICWNEFLNIQLIDFVDTFYFGGGESICRLRPASDKNTLRKFQETEKHVKIRIKISDSHLKQKWGTRPVNLGPRIPKTGHWFVWCVCFHPTTILKDLAFNKFIELFGHPVESEFQSFNFYQL